MQKIILPTLLLAMSSSAFSADNTGFYIGTGYGSFSYDATEIKIDEVEEYQAMAGISSAPLENLIKSTSGNTLKIYAGYQFNNVFALEATYTDYGTSEGYITHFDKSTTTIEQNPTSLSVAMNIGYTFRYGIRPFVLLGVSSVTLNSSDVFLDSADESFIAIKYGFGLEYSPQYLRGVQLRVAYETDTYFAEIEGKNDSNIYAFPLNSVYAGISYKF
ncbi:hypothetical protein PCNPT3_00150 [Psychromonas sp. CNPT3]|uniref:outer membrane protein n=1 Tax=Psychromonas sp. CNPT3 TaxID=314282 RepID=UPI00006E792B|nr:outer membrane beta-barrel protein [Psychromonas sp. CNPT3]AGH79972.1 hypothetical protein PCNPT3_00150 [Psychromonas sp. CNPT3]